MMELLRPKPKETKSAPESRPYRVRGAFKESTPERLQPKKTDGKI
jgi:hypothetical protein